LTGKGFKQVFNLKGGIAAWQGHSAAGPSEMGMMLLKGNETPQEIIYLAYGLEEGLRKFYSRSSNLAIDSAVVGVLAKLAEIEVKHKQRLFDLYLTIDANPLNVEAFENNVSSVFMEGGFDPDSLMEQSLSEFKTTASVLDFAMMLEAQAMDLYMRYAEKSKDPEAKNIFYKMADEEKAHLKSLGSILDKNLGSK
jgi:sulfur-carrier protein adenylyltransferase/sulfurtransferase